MGRSGGPVWTILDVEVDEESPGNFGAEFCDKVVEEDFDVPTGLAVPVDELGGLDEPGGNDEPGGIDEPGNRGARLGENIVEAGVRDVEDDDDVGAVGL